MKIFVGSLNPVKINAVTLAASESWPSVEVYGLDVPSGIAEQPMSDEETRKGATTRAQAALEDGLRRIAHAANGVVTTDGVDAVDQAESILGVGLEGGVFQRDDGELWSTVWAVVIDSEGRLFESNGARFKVPEKIASQILEGAEMGSIVSKMLGGADVKRQQGAIGVITNNFVDRTEEYSIIVKLALGLWYGRDWENQVNLGSHPDK